MDQQSSRDTFQFDPGAPDELSSGPTGACCRICASLLGAPCRWSSRLGQYRTVKTVAVHSVQLSWIHYGLQALIFGYIIVWTVAINKGYLRVETPSGYARVTIKQPGWHMESPPPWKPHQSLSYCEGGTPVAGQIPNSGSKLLSLPCLYKDEYFLYKPVPGGVLITTRCTEYAQSLPASCIRPKASNCNEWSKATTDNYFVAQAENYTIQFDHGIIAPDAGISVQSRDTNIVDAWIEDQNGNRLDPCEDYEGELEKCPTEVVHVGPPRTAPECKTNTDCTDLMPLQTLLRAAGITNLDTEGDVESTKKGKTGVASYRYTGFTLHITAFYDNTFSYDQTKFRYRYRVNHVARTEFKLEETVPINATARMLLNRHGLKIVVDVGGNVGRFDEQTLLIQLVSSMGLLAVASTITGLLAGHIENEYTASKYEHVGSRRFVQSSHQLAEHLSAQLFEDGSSSLSLRSPRDPSTEPTEMVSAFGASSATSGLRISQEGFDSTPNPVATKP